MRKLNVLLIAAVGGPLFTLTSKAQDTNACPEVPKTKLEALATRTGVVVIKGTAQIGSVSAKGGIVSVRCKEFTDTSTGRKEYGLGIGVRESDQAKDTTFIDYDEIDSLLNGLDLLSKVDWSATALTGFEAVYTTSGGLRIATYSNKRNNTIEAVVQSSRPGKAPALLSMVQFTQLRGIIDEAKRRLDSIRPTQ